MYRREEYNPDVRRIISVDGEGSDIDGRHAYTLLAAADDRGFRAFIEHDGERRDGTVETGQRASSDDYAPNYGLRSADCIEFLLSLPRHKSDLIISFSFTYDVTKLLADMPYVNQVELSTRNKTTWGDCVIECIPRKHLSLTLGERSVKVWDTFSYWQSAFIKALNGSRQLFSDEQLKTIDYIAEMKELRNEAFAGKSADDIREYCFNECEFLSILYRDLLRHCVELGLKPTKHSGPGALATAFFTSRNVERYMPWGDAFQQCGMPRSVPISAYYGGRFETSVLGDVGDVIQYDIHSAYPAVAVNLPCLKCGMFERATDYMPGAWGFYYVESDTSGPWAPFPFRCDAKSGKEYLNGALNGSIAFVHGGRRWVTGDEVEVAIRHFGAERIRVLDGWYYIPACEHRPFAEIETLYRQRKDPQYGASAGTKQIIKLIINSVYGKTAQSIGGKDGPPRFQCYIWAAWMTGSTRAKVLDAALYGGESVVSIATDGILSTREIPELEVTDWTLGTWERVEKQDCWLGMPGIYSFNDGKGGAFKRRGLDARYFPADYLRSAFHNGQWRVKPTETVRGFMPMRLGVRRANWADVVGQWVEMPKTVSFSSVMRKRNLPEDVDPFMPHDGTALALTPFTVPLDLESVPYTPKVSYFDDYADLLDPDMSMIADLDMSALNTQ